MHHMRLLVSRAPQADHGSRSATARRFALAACPDLSNDDVSVWQCDRFSHETTCRRARPSGFERDPAVRACDTLTDDAACNRLNTREAYIGIKPQYARCLHRARESRTRDDQQKANERSSLHCVRPC